MTKKPKINPLVLYRRENTEINSNINKMNNSVENKDISEKFRKNKLNIINSQNSNLPSTISDSKNKEKDIKYIKPKTETNRQNQKIRNIKLKGKKIKKINIENDNNIKILKKNLNIKIEDDIVERKRMNIKNKKENNNINNKQEQLKAITNINTYENNKTKENKYTKTERGLNKRIKPLKKKVNNNSKQNISSFDKRKKYIVPIIKQKKKKKIENKKEKNKNIILDKNTIEIKEMLASNLITNKQIEYLRDYQKYINDYNNKMYKNNEKKFRFIQEEGIDLDDLLLDDDNMNDTIDEINEKEEGDEVQESI